MTAPSRLSSLLVRDGLLGVKRMEQAFQRQVIYGGALDTILLEMNAVPEDRLVQYLSLATGLPAADRDMAQYFDPRAVQVCPRQVAETYHVAPVALDGPALRCLVTDPVDLVGLESLATQLGTPVQPFVVPEYRFHLLLERLFGISPPSRFALLAAKRAQAAQAHPASEPKVIIDDTAEPPPLDARSRSTISFSTDALHRALAEQEARRAAAAAHTAGEPPTVAAAPAMEEVVVAPLGGPSHPVGAATRGSVPMNTVVPVEPAAETDTVVVSEADNDTVVAEVALGEATASTGPETSPPAGVVRAPWRGGNTIDPRPLEPADAVAELARANDRDSIFAALVRAARARTWYAALLTVQGGMAFGRVAIDGDEPDADITQVGIPLEGAHALRGALDGRAPYIGPVRGNMPEVDVMLERMGGVIPPQALLLPVVIKERAVALIYAHRGADTVSIAEVAELLPLAHDAALALGRLIVRAKAEGYRRAEAEPAPAPSLAVEDLPSKAKDGRRGDGVWVKPGGEVTVVMPPPGQFEFGTEVSLTADLPGPIGRVIDLMESGAEPSSTHATEEALARAEEALPEIARRFPGKLWVDRYGTGARGVRASQHGALLALVVRLGPRVVPLLIDKMTAEDREVRYYATLCCGEVRAPIAVPALVNRLFDHDYGVRGAALEALLGHPARDIDAALEPVRRALRADSTKARAAARALCELRDVRAVPDLLEALDRDHMTAEEAHRALVELCKQDFGTKSKKWRAWWDKNKERPRIEWMLDALGHSEDRVRLSASEELKRLTGEYFGYHHDLPKREREEARLRWMKWWEETGRRRFLRDDGRNENDRTTAMLPTLPRR